MLVALLSCPIFEIHVFSLAKDSSTIVAFHFVLVAFLFNISLPFWLEEKTSPSCGVPHFELSTIIENKCTIARPKMQCSC